MKTIYTTLAILSIGLFGVVSAAQAQSLFTDDDLSSVLKTDDAASSDDIDKEKANLDQEEPPAPEGRDYDKPKEKTPAEEAARDEQIQPATLAQLLTDSGLEPKKLSERAYSFELQAGQHTVPTIVELSADNKVLWFSCRMTKIGEVDTVRPENLLKMLTFNRANGPLFFEVIDSNKMIVLTRPSPNVDISVRSFTQLTNLFRSKITENEEIWNTRRWVASNAVNVQGIWLSDAPDTRMRLSLEEDGKFSLYRKAAGNEVRLKGEYEFSGNELVMTDDQGRKTTATIVKIDEDNFELRTAGAVDIGLKFTRI